MNFEGDLQSRWNLLRQNLAIGAENPPAGNSPAASIGHQHPRLARFRPIILAALALFLVWEILTRGVAAYLAEINPEAAVWLRSTQPTALTKLADQRLNPEPKAAGPGQTPQEGQQTSSTETLDDTNAGGQRSSAQGGLLESAELTKEEMDQIKTWAELALRNDPLNARALRILGQLAQRASDNERADALMQAAAQRSRRESYAVFFMMQKSYQDQDFGAALSYADTLLRTRNYLVLPHVMPILGKIAETPAANAELKQLLAKNPPWRPQFFYSLPGHVSDARTPLDIFLSLRNSSTPPTARDLRSYLEFLVQRGFHELAYYSWLQFLPPEQLAKAGRLFNGNFEIIPTGLPFDWVFSGGTGVNIQVAPRPDQIGGKALLIEFGPGRVDFGGVAQLVLLPAGSYQLKGKYKSNLVSLRGLQWRIACGTKSIGESRHVKGIEPVWNDFEVSFTVPPDDCPVQYVSLALDSRSTSDTFVSGSIWYDELSITRDPDAPEQNPQ